MFIWHATVSPQAFTTVPHFFCRGPQSVYRLSLYQHLVLILPFYILYLPRSQFLLLSGPLLSTIHPPRPLSLLSPLPPFPPSHPLPHSLFPLLAFLCSGPIGSHYIDGPDDSVEWCTLSPVPLQGLSLQSAHAAAFSSDRKPPLFLCGHK